MGNAISEENDATVFQEPHSDTIVTDDYATTDNEERTWHDARAASTTPTKTSLSTPKHDMDRYSPVRRRRHQQIVEEDVTTQPSSSEGESSITWHPQLKIDTVSDADELTAMTDMAHDGALELEYSMEQPSLQPGSSIERYRSRSILSGSSPRARGLSPRQLPKNSLIEPSSESQGNEDIINAEEEYSKVMTEKEEEDDVEPSSPHHGLVDDDDDLDDDADDEEEEEDSSSEGEEEETGEISEDDGDKDDDGYDGEEEVASAFVRSPRNGVPLIHHTENKVNIDPDSVSLPMDFPRGRKHKVTPRSIKSASTKHHANHARQKSIKSFAGNEIYTSPKSAPPKRALSNLSRSEEWHNTGYEASRKSGSKFDPISLVNEAPVPLVKNSFEASNHSRRDIDDTIYDATSEGAVRGASLSPLQINTQRGVERDSRYNELSPGTTNAMMDEDTNTQDDFERHSRLLYNELSPGTTNAMMDDEMSQTSDSPPQALLDLMEPSVSQDFVVKVGEKMKVISLGSNEEETVPETATLVTQTIDGSARSHDRPQDGTSDVSNSDGSSTTSQDNCDMVPETNSYFPEEHDGSTKSEFMDGKSRTDVSGMSSKRSCDPDGLKSFDNEVPEVNKRGNTARRVLDIRRPSAVAAAHANHGTTHKAQGSASFNVKASMAASPASTGHTSPNKMALSLQNSDLLHRQAQEEPLVAQAPIGHETNNPNSPSDLKQLTSADFEDIDMNFVEEYDAAFTKFLAQYPHLIKSNPEMIDNLRVAKLQLLLEATSYVEDELIDYVKVLHAKKKEMADFYQVQLLDAAKKKAAREIHLQQEYNTLERSTRMMEGKLTWQFMLMCEARAKKQAQMMQQFAEMETDAENPLSMLPPSIHTQLVRDAVNASPAIDVLSEEHVKELQQFQVDHAFLKAEVTVLEKKLAYQAAVAKRYSWVDSVFKRLDKKQLKRLRSRYESKLGVSLK